MERDLAKIGTLMVFGAILFDILTHGQAATDILNVLRRWFLGGLGVVATGNPNVQ